MKLLNIPIEKPSETNVILGQSHFIKTVEDVHEAIINAGGNTKFGLAFLEASGPTLVRSSGNSKSLQDLAEQNALALGTGHAFIVFLEEGFPLNVLNNIKAVPEVCNIFCATANDVEVIVAQTQKGRGILGVVDGGSPKEVETEKDVHDRKRLLRDLGYKL